MAYTSQYDTSRIPHVPVIEIVVGNPEKSPAPVILKGRIDTGADCTVIPLEVVERLDLPPRREREVKDFSGKSHKVQFYSAQVTIPTLKERPVELIGIAGPEALVGRNILNHYKVTLDGRQKKIEIE